MNATEIVLICCLAVALVLIMALLIYIFIKKRKAVNSNQDETTSDQFERSKNVFISNNNLTEIWSLYVNQQSELLKEIVPIIDILLKENNRTKINKMLQKAIKSDGKTANKESTESNKAETKENTSLILDYDKMPNDIKIIWGSFIEHQNELLKQFETVFKDAELYFQRMIEPLDSCLDEEEKRTGIWAQIERYKWTSVGLSQVQNISDKFLQCKDISQYYQLSISLAQIMLSYMDVIK